MYEGAEYSKSYLDFVFASDIHTVAQLNAEQESLILRLAMCTFPKVVDEMVKNMKMDCRNQHQDTEAELVFDVILLYATVVHKRTT